jgi:hypothetical protein
VSGKSAAGGSGSKRECESDKGQSQSKKAKLVERGSPGDTGNESAESGQDLTGVGGGDDEDPEKRKSKPEASTDDVDDDDQEEDEEEEEGEEEEEEGEEEDVEGEMEALFAQGDGKTEDQEEEEDNDSIVPSSHSSGQGTPSRESTSSSAVTGPTPAEGNNGWLSYKELMETTYPAKSRRLYLAAFVTLEKFLKRHKIFDRSSPPASTLWSHFSRINAVMKRTWGVNLTKYPRLSDLLKGYESGHRPKKASVFTPQQGNLTIVICQIYLLLGFHFIIYLS